MRDWWTWVSLGSGVGFCVVLFVFGELEAFRSWEISSVWLAIFSVAAGHIAVSHAPRNRAAVAGLVIWYAALGLSVWVVGQTAVYQHFQRPNEASAVATLFTIHDVELELKRIEPDKPFECDLDELGAARHRHEPMLDEQLVKGKKGAYLYSLRGCSDSRFVAIAVPDPNRKGAKRTFCVDETRDVKTSLEATAEACVTNGKPVM